MSDTIDRFQRTAMLIGRENVDKLKTAGWRFSALAVVKDLLF